MLWELKLIGTLFSNIKFKWIQQVKHWTTDLRLLSKKWTEAYKWKVDYQFDIFLILCLQMSIFGSILEKIFVQIKQAGKKNLVISVQAYRK